MFWLQWSHRILLVNTGKLLISQVPKVKGRGFVYVSSISLNKYTVSRCFVMSARSTIENEPRKNGFKFTDYDCIGFDLDNTICRYKISNVIQLEYDALARYLIEKKGYSSKHLHLPLSENIDFMLKGLMLDVDNGNIIRLAADGHIMHASHGTIELTHAELEEYYGKELRWTVTDMFSKDPLHTWNGPSSEQLRTLLDYFDLPASLVFARAVNTVDEANGKRQEKYKIWPDILEGLQEMFSKEHFLLNKGDYFPFIKANPDLYINKCSESLISWLKELRSQKKILFLITGSNVDFATHTASVSLGNNWKDLFDIVVVYAKKPGFFTAERPFIRLEGFEEVGPIDAKDLQKGGTYSYGNWKGLYEFLKKHSSKEDPKVLYVGDNIIQDVYTPAVHTPSDTVAICEELEAEGIFGHDDSHVDKHFLVSEKWGSYFSHKSEPKKSIWHKIIHNHAKLAVPSLEYVANKPIDYQF